MSNLERIQQLGDALRTRFPDGVPPAADLSAEDLAWCRQCLREYTDALDDLSGELWESWRLILESLPAPPAPTLPPARR